MILLLIGKTGDKKCISNMGPNVVIEILSIKQEGVLLGITNSDDFPLTDACTPIPWALPSIAPGETVEIDGEAYKITHIGVNPHEDKT